MSEKSDQKKLHYELTNVGLRAQATAVGLLQLCSELRRAGVLDEGAISRIKDAIADEIVVCAPRPVAGRDYRQEVRTRLNHLFAGDQKLGPADEMLFAPPPED
ncbi:hypothetical protein [Sphingobium sp.]|uniref:hypothetical protein n=1 Tax=Sphingobium sp. TaxID=1912891 RepID=UPI003BB69553